MAKIRRHPQISKRKISDWEAYGKPAEAKRGRPPTRKPAKTKAAATAALEPATAHRPVSARVKPKSQPKRGATTMPQGTSTRSHSDTETAGSGAQAAASATKHAASATVAKVKAALEKIAHARNDPALVQKEAEDAIAAIEAWEKEVASLAPTAMTDSDGPLATVLVK